MFSQKQKWMPFLFCLLFAFASLEATVLFGVRKDSGTLEQIDPNTGNIISSFGGITNATSIDFSQGSLGQELYAVINDSTNDRVVKIDENGNSSTFIDLGGGNAEPWDISFDSSGNLYITTDTQVQKYDSNGNLTLSFNHGLTAIRGFVINQKEIGITVNPVNGDIAVAGHSSSNASARVFDSSGNLRGDIQDTGFILGAAAIQYTPDGSQFYIAEFEGNDTMRIIDSNTLQQVSSFNIFTTSNTGVDELAGMEFDPVTGDLYMGGTTNSFGLVKINSSNQFVYGKAPFYRDFALASEFEAPNTVPEPSSFYLLFGGLLLFLRKRD